MWCVVVVAMHCEVDRPCECWVGVEWSLQELPMRCAGQIPGDYYRGIAVWTERLLRTTLWRSGPFDQSQPSIGVIYLETLFTPYMVRDVL